MFKRITRAVRDRLSSERGASILFALFTLLVCLTVGSVVLTAGTAASGRLAETAKNDQRYYAVSSAADIIKDMIAGQEITVTKQKIETTKTTHTYIYDPEKSLSDTEPKNPKDQGTSVDSREEKYLVRLIDADGSVTDNMREAGFCHSRAIDLVLGTDFTSVESAGNEKMKELYEDDESRITEEPETPGEEYGTNYTITVDGSDSLKVTVTCQQKKDGSLLFRLTSEDGSYTAYLTFSADKKEFEEKTMKKDTLEHKVEPPSSTETDESKKHLYTETTKVAETFEKSTTIKWTFQGMSQFKPVSWVDQSAS